MKGRPLDGAVEEDLRRWVQRFYVQRQLLVAERSRAAAERIFDQERHVLTGLSAQLMATIGLIPWWGATGVLTSLAILYVGTLLSGAWTLGRVRGVWGSRPSKSAEAEAQAALATSPVLDADTRALLIRLMNLSAVRPTPRGHHLLVQELREALDDPTLSGWRFLHDLTAALDGPDGARLWTLQPELAR